MRRALRALSVVLIVSGTLLIVDAGITLAWQEPISALIAQFSQDELSDELDALEDQPLSATDEAALRELRTERLRMRYLARKLDRDAGNGQAIGRIELPTLDNDFVFVQGTDSDALQKGPGHYDDTPLPGAPGTVAVAGHRTTYLAPFRDINELGSGDEIVLRMPYGTFIYRFQEQKIVEPTAVYVTKRVGYDRLVLTACHPLYSAAQRIVVFARLVAARPRGAARRALDPIERDWTLSGRSANLSSSVVADASTSALERSMTTSTPGQRGWVVRHTLTTCPPEDPCSPLPTIAI